MNEPETNRSTEMLRLISDRAEHFSIVILAPDGSITSCAGSTEDIEGFVPEELIGKHISVFMTPEDREAGAAEGLLRRAADQGQVETEGLRVRRDGTRYSASVLTSALRDLNGELIGFVCIVRDVSRRLHALDLLRESEERHRHLVESATDVIYTHDLAGCLLSVNTAGEKLFGIPREELIGRSIFDIVTPEFHDHVSAMIAQKIEQGGGTTHALDVVTRDGRTVALEVSTQLIYEHGQAVGVQGIARDITERKQLEAHVRTAEKIEAVRQLAGGVAHDFNNLLTAIRGHVDLLLAEAPPDASFRSDIDEIRKGADRAAALTQQLLAFSRQQILQPRVLEVDEVVSGVDTLLRRLIGEHVTLSTDLRAGAACVRADRDRLEQILMNLAVNARDAMPKGGQLGISTHVVDRGEGFVRANPGSRPGRFVQLEVSDNGQGMTEDTLSHLFEPFFTTKELGRGTGLGLATVYGIVKQSDGYIRVESQLGLGTRFEVLLPLVDAVPEPERETAPVHAPAVQNATLLVAEDEDAVRSLACRVLRKQGFQVLEASNGADAIDVARRYAGDIDLVLSDIVMPYMGGRDLVEQLLQVRPNMKVVFMSGYTSDALLQRGVNDAGGGFLEKPFTPAALVSKVREILESN